VGVEGEASNPGVSTLGVSDGRVKIWPSTAF
jgi:hypothetical protein